MLYDKGSSAQRNDQFNPNGGGPKSRSRTGETVTLSYESIEWTYVKIDSTTGRVISAAAAQWNLPAKEGQQDNR